MHPQQSVADGTVAAVFDAAADTWRRLGPPGEEQVDRMIQWLGYRPGSTVVDAGCGAGRWSIALARKGCRVRGIDIAPRMIAAAADAARGHPVHPGSVHFEVGDIAQLAVATALADALLCLNVLDFVPRPGAALGEFWRVLKPGGRAVLGVLGAYSPVKRDWWRRFRDPPGPSSFAGNGILPWELEALLGDLGWHIAAQEPSFNPTVAGVANDYTSETAAHLADPVLRQTVATAWTFVVRRP